jgi:hypothetical protein
MYAQAITDALSQQLPRGTYVCWDTDDFLMSQEEGMSTMQTPTIPQDQPQENTQEELAS